MSVNSNEQVDPQCEHALRVAVERVVRPVYADEARKMRMRNELYAHALDAFRHERGRGVAAAQAIAAAVDRLGEPAELTAELQADTPWGSRYGAFIEQMTRRKAATPRWRFAAWMAFIGMIIVPGPMVLIQLIELTGLTRLSSPEHSEVFAKMMVYFACMAASCFGVAAYFGSLVREELAGEPRRRAPSWRVVGWSMTAGLLFLVAGLFFFPIVGSPSLLWHPVYVGCWLTLSVLVAAGMIFVAWSDVRERRELEQDWLALEID